MLLRSIESGFINRSYIVFKIVINSDKIFYIKSKIQHLKQQEWLDLF